MTKFALFFIFVIIGALSSLILLNQNQKELVNNNPLISPTNSPLNLIALTKPPQKISIPSVSISEKSKNPIVVNKAIIKTSKGNITLSFFGKDAPKTINNFLEKAVSGFYNNLTFHRVEDWVIQGGDPLGNGKGGGNINVELNNNPFVTGSLGVASRGDGKVQNDAQFFIIKTDAPWLNGKYTNFGFVIEGMDIVNKIEVGDKILEIVLE